MVKVVHVILFLDNFQIPPPDNTLTVPKAKLTLNPKPYVKALMVQTDIMQ